MIKKVFLAVLLTQGVLMSKNVINVEVNGVAVPVIFEEDKSLPIASMQLVFLAAGSMEDNGTDGLARFSAAMLNEGTAKIKAADFAEELENRAISFGVSAGKETLVFELSSLKEEFAFGAKMVKAVLEKPNFSKEAFKKVNMQTLGEILSKESDFDYIASLKLKELMYAKTPLGSASLGTKESLQKINTTIVEKFVKSRLDLSNLIVIVGGDISADEVKTILKDTLSSLPKGVKRELGFYDAAATKDYSVQFKKSEQAYIYFGAPFYMKLDDKDAHKAKVASFILGESGFGSRLMEEIRVKKGLAYSAYSRFNFDKTTSSFSGYLQTKTQTLREARELVEKIIKDFTDKGATKAELEQAKKFLLGSEPLRVETLSQRLSRSFGEYYSGLGLGYSKEQLKKIENLSLEELNEFIKNHKEINELIFSIVTNDAPA
ncbi:MAG: insulinase family protein [Campylobacteraceae bacterium]|jgi:predicted Zn-dependent peptidase|nr:insulinase family protein [Campylobacteraceae bacterium]